MSLENSELILNSDGSVYHLNLLPEHIAQDIIFVGDQYRVEKISKHFDMVEFSTQKREFKTTTGYYKGKKLSVISTGIGPDNIDIVMNELDALVNIDLQTRKIKPELTSLNIVRVGTSGSLQKSIPVDSFVLGTHGLDLNGMIHAYKVDEISLHELEEAFVAHTNWSGKKADPVIVACDPDLERRLTSLKTYKGMTATAGGFYGPQGRVLRLAIQDPELNHKIDSFNYNGIFVSNLEMETSAIYAMAKLLGHKACSLNAIIANRANGTFSENPGKVVEELIEYTLEKLTQ